jgi:hypothetical protein
VEDRATALGSSLIQRAVISWTFGLSYQHITIERTGTRQTSGPGGHLFFCRVHDGSLSLLPICPVAATGKPFFVPPSYYQENIPSLPAWNYNVSHDGRLIVCAAEASRIIIMYIYSYMASQCLDHAWHFCNVELCRLSGVYKYQMLQADRLVGIDVVDPTKSHRSVDRYYWMQLYIVILLL